MAVSIQQAATNAFVTYLQSKLGDCVIEPRWPAPDRKLVSKTITAIMSGPRRDESIEPRILSKTNSGSNQTNVVWQVASCYQPMQLDLWCIGHHERDDVMARMDEHLRAGSSALTGAFNPEPVGAGCLIKVMDGWQAYNTTADFIFEDPETDDEPNSVDRCQFRATYRGGAYFSLAIQKTSSRQVTINVPLLLDGVEFKTFSIT